jgi:hypothetical protein
VRYNAAMIGAEADRTASSAVDEQKFERRAPEAALKVVGQGERTPSVRHRRRGKLFSCLTMKE